MLNIVVVGKKCAETRRIMETGEDLLASNGINNAEFSHAFQLPSLQCFRANPNLPHIVVRGTDEKETKFVTWLLSNNLNVSIAWVEANVFLTAILHHS